MGPHSLWGDRVTEKNYCKDCSWCGFKRGSRLVHPSEWSCNVVSVESPLNGEVSHPFTQTCEERRKGSMRDSCPDYEERSAERLHPDRMGEPSATAIVCLSQPLPVRWASIIGFQIKRGRSCLGRALHWIEKRLTRGME